MKRKILKWAIKYIVEKFLYWTIKNFKGAELTVKTTTRSDDTTYWIVAEISINIEGKNVYYNTKVIHLTPPKGVSHEVMRITNEKAIEKTIADAFEILDKTTL